MWFRVLPPFSGCPEADSLAPRGQWKSRAGGVHSLPLASGVCDASVWRVKKSPGQAGSRSGWEQGFWVREEEGMQKKGSSFLDGRQEQSGQDGGGLGWGGGLLFQVAESTRICHRKISNIKQLVNLECSFLHPVIVYIC